MLIGVVCDTLHGLDALVGLTLHDIARGRRKSAAQRLLYFALLTLSGRGFLRLGQILRAHAASVSGLQQYATAEEGIELVTTAIRQVHAERCAGI